MKLFATSALAIALSPLLAAPTWAAAPVAAAQTGGPALDGLKYRLVGPFRGGRATGVAGVPGDPSTFYFGAAAGGLWKTIDGGVSWKPLWDAFPEASPAVGAIAVAASNPATVYVGTGETNIRGDVVTGNGLYKSTDAGKTWRFSGLRDTQVIGRIVVDSHDANTVFVAALGHPFGDNPERGVFKSTDGGASWRKVLFVDAKTGAVDVKFDPSNPKILYAGMWQVYRKPWIMESGGPGSGLYKSVDGGETWTRLQGGGLPEGVLGRINVAPTSDPKRVYAMIEAEKGGLYRTDDGGRTWALINAKNDYRQRAWYFNTVFADPKNPDVVYVLNTQAYRSKDGGKSFKSLHTRHLDNHEMWIDPSNPAHMINSNDGGADISIDGGETWTSQMNQPTGQFYHIATDDQFPSRLYGAQQDDGTVSIATAGRSGGVGIEDWYAVGGGESGFVVPDPADPQIVYAGGYDAEITRYDHRTDMARQITPWPRNTMGWAAAPLQNRFQWTAPIMVSKREPHALYFASQYLFRSADAGQSWSVISPDLTRNDKSKQQSSGGPITKDNTSVETYDTIFAVAESPVQAGLLWVGSDDGLVHLTHDDGAHWSDATPPALPAWSTVDMIEPDPRQAGVAYLAADRRRLDDFTPYAFRTRDFGRSWTPITTGIPADAYVHVVRVDPARAGLLYAGTERGVFVSYDDGDHWAPLQLNLPVTPVHDLVVHGSTLGVATHGRAFWVIDDLSPVRQWPGDATHAKALLLQPAPANRTTFPTRLTELRDGGGDNPPAGAVIYYALPASLGSPRPPEGKDKDADAKPKTPDPFAARLKLEILDGQGRVVRTFPDPHDKAVAAAKPDTKSAPKTEPEPDEAEDEEVQGPKKAKLTHFSGLNSFVWDLHYEGATSIPHSPLWAGSVAGPKALPGRYQVRLTLDGQRQVAPLDILSDPRGTATMQQLQQQFDLHQAINAELTQVHEAVLDIRATRAHILATEKAESGKSDSARLTTAADALDGRMTGIEEALIQPRAHASEDALNYPVRLNNMLAALGSLVGSGDAAPTDQDQQMFLALKSEAELQLSAWRQLKNSGVQAFDQMAGTIALQFGGEHVAHRLRAAAE